MITLNDESMQYVISIYRQLHQYPEIGFDLPMTAALVKRELDSMGIFYTEQYGQGSVVAQIGDRKDRPTVGLRADMDALPVNEIADVPFASRIDGVMHACGYIYPKYSKC